MSAAHRAVLSAAADQLRSPAFARAYALTALTAAFLTAALDRTAGEVTVATIVAGLAALGGALLVARRDELSTIGFAPTSLVLFAAWALISVFWALDGARERTLAAWIALAAWTIVALAVAHTRDTLQIARAMGDVLRWLLTVSLALEILFGILLDVPFPALGITAEIAYGGPVQGVFGSRNLLGFVAVLALVTFVIEWRARSVAGHVAAYSIALAGLLTVLSGSPTALVLMASVVVATAALGIVRRARPEKRRQVNIAIAGTAAFVLLVLLALRHQVIGWLAARSDFETRADLWNEVVTWARHRPITGWSWFGDWHEQPFPTNVVNIALGSHNGSALSAYFDLLLQLGWVGLLLFVLLILLALVRAWLAASARRSVVHAWLPLVIVLLVVESAFESYTLTGLGWLLLVVATARAGKERSWRIALDPTAPIPPPAPRGNQEPDDRAG